MVKYLMSSGIEDHTFGPINLSGIEDHTFGPINLREHFPEEELTLGKNRFLEVASLVE